MKYKFSIVMAVYNVEPFIREAIDSVIAQDIGFQHVQLILVDDGTKDNSGIICDEYAAKYPDNILALHKENGGVSSARNLGLDHVQGEYVNFLDSDDKLSRNALRKVYAFFQKHKDETDIVAIPMYFFDGQTGGHILNDKFQNGSRVIDLETEWAVTQLSLSSAFVSQHCIHSRRFDVRLSHTEDAQLVQKMLAGKKTLGVVADVSYHYRRRSTGETSAVQKSAKQISWYSPCLQHYHQEIIRYYTKQENTLPRFVQYGLMYDMQWRWMQKTLPADILSEAEMKLYRQEMHDLLGYIDKKVILAQKSLPIVYKELLLWKKSESETLSSCRLDFMQWKKNTFLLEGRVALPPEQLDDAQVEILVNGKTFPCQMYPCHNRILMLDEPVAGYVGFHAEIPYPTNNKTQSIAFTVRIGGDQVPLEHLDFGKFFPVGNKYHHSYCIHNGWLLTTDTNVLHIRPAKWWDGMIREPAYLAEIWKVNAHGGRKSIPVRIAYPFLKLLKRKPLWLISDRSSKAGDNGEALFRYIRENYPDIDARFVINRHCPDYQTTQTIGPVLGFRSLHHRFIAPLADFVISSQGEGKIYNPFDGYSESYRDLFADTKFVFLQHGVIKDDLSDWLSRFNNNFSGFVTSAVPEYESIVKGKYHFPPEHIWLTGLPRFDRLYQAEQKQITIMPTWRRYLMGSLDIDSGKWSILPGFERSSYVRFYSDLLSSPKLISAAKRLGYKIAFFPHPNIQPHLKHFDMDPSVELLGTETEYRDIYAQSSLVVTDFSSAVFDFAYLRKPVLYTQFDAEAFFAGEHVYEKGYFDYERDGFGEVEYDLDGAVDRIIEYMENDCQLKDKYRQRIDGFFAFNDQNNCQRVFDKIMELDKIEG